MKAMWIAIAIVAIAVITYIWSGVVRSTRYSGAADVTVSPGSDVAGDFITAGRNVNVQTKIEGDLAAAGSNVTVMGPVLGYVIAAGSDVNVNGAVGNDLWAAGSNVSVNAPVTDNARLAGSLVTLQPQASVGRDAYLAGSQVEVLGRVEHNLNVTAANVKLASEVGGSVKARAGRVEALPGAVIRGDLIVTGPRAPEIATGAQVLGRVVYNAEAGGGRWGLLNWLVWWVSTFLAVMILGAAVIALSARWTDRITEKLSRNFGYSLLAGIIGMIVVPLICVVLAVTVIGIPLAIVLFALYGVALALASSCRTGLAAGCLDGCGELKLRPTPG